MTTGHNDRNHDNDDGHGDGDEVLSDLVEYLVIHAPAPDSLSSVGAALIALVEQSTIRILDVVGVTTDEFGGVHEFSLDSVRDLGTLATHAHSHGSLLSTRDVRLAAAALPPRSAGLVVLTEDRWAAPLDAAARRVGGRIIAGDRISAHRVTLALAHDRATNEGALT